MSFIFFRNFSRLRNCLMISTRIRQYYSGKSLFDRYDAYPLMLLVNTKALHRSLIDMPWSIKCHANFSSASEENDEPQCKRHHELDRTGQPVKVPEFNLTIKKVLVTCKGTTMSVKEEELLKLEMLKLCGWGHIKIKILICLTVHMCAKDEKVGTEADGVDKELADSMANQCSDGKVLSVSFSLYLCMAK